MVKPSVGGVGQHLAFEIYVHISLSGTFSVSRRLASGTGLALPFALYSELRAFDGDGPIAKIFVLEDPAEGNAVAGDLLKPARSS